MKSLLFLFSFALAISSCCTKDHCQEDADQLISEKYFKGKVDLKATDQNPIGLIKIDFDKDKVKYAIYKFSDAGKVLGNDTEVYVKLKQVCDVPTVYELQTSAVDASLVNMDPKLADEIKMDLHGFFTVLEHPSGPSHSKIHHVTQADYNQPLGVTTITAAVDGNNAKQFLLIGTIQDNGIAAVPFNRELFYTYISPSMPTDPIPVISVDTEHTH